jgi:hypothetical protein
MLAACLLGHQITLVTGQGFVSDDVGSDVLSGRVGPKNVHEEPVNAMEK